MSSFWREGGVSRRLPCRGVRRTVSAGVDDGWVRETRLWAAAVGGGLPSVCGGGKEEMRV